MPARLKSPVVTIGTFDGVHRGHQIMLRELSRWAKKLGTTSLVVTFDRSPKTLTRNMPAPCITSLEHRLVLFETLGIDAVVVLPFDRRFSRTPARKFVEDTLVKKLRVQGILLGYNCRFGRNAEGGMELLRRLEKEGVIKAREVRLPVLASGRPISSSAIREAIEAGKLREAQRMLGRPVALLGTVVHGRGVGRRLGAPTANLDLHHEALPPDGVYATAARIGQKWIPALTSIGRQPTFRKLKKPVVEVFIPGFKGRLYGRDIEIRFVKKLREQQRFATAEKLVAQIERDRKSLGKICIKRWTR